MRRKTVTILISLISFAAFNQVIFSQELEADSKTLLLLHFNGNATGAQGETPSTNNNVTYETGVHGQGAYLGAGNQLYYANANNISATEGTVEFWIKPRWNGNDGVTHCFFSWGTTFFIQKDGGNNLRFIINNDDSEGNKAFNLSGWNANQWHHIVITWKIPGSMNTYVDGVLKITNSASAQDLFSNTTSQISIGSKQSANVANAVYDEFRISNAARTEQEIQNSFLAGLSVKSLEIRTDYTKLWKTWKATPEAIVTTNDNSQFTLPSNSVAWNSSNVNIATVNSSGLVIAQSGGSVDISGTFRGFTSKVTYNNVNPILNPVEETIDPYLSTPAQNYLYEIPVIIIRYLPSTDGNLLDVAYAPDYWSLNPVPLNTMKATLDRFDKRTKFILEEGSKFHGYKIPNSKPSLGYKIIKIITVYEPVPPGRFWFMSRDRKAFYVDYNSIFERFGLRNYMEANNVKEVWLNYGYILPDWPSYNASIHGPEAMVNLVESNMSSPTTGDVSNSARLNDDLPILNHTYTLYDYNIRRSHAENIENHMHQLETLYGYINGNFFWEKFVGFANDRITLPARSGWAHFPPNGTDHYDWANKNFISSDIEDWNPDNTGLRKMVNCDTWCSIQRNWPDNVNVNWSTDYSSNWFLYLMQNWPGHGNQIQYGANWMSNWWEFTADWDKAINENLGLYKSTPNVLPAPYANPATSITQTSFTANWNSTPNTTKYFLDIATDAAFTNLVTGFNNKDVENVTTYPCTGLSTGTNYYYRVRSYNSNATSENSNIVEVEMPQGPPTVPTALTASSITQTSFTANWNPVSNATKYFLDIATDNGFTNFVTGFNNKDVGNITNLLVNNLAPNTPYYYRVRSYNQTATSSSSNVISVQTLAGPATATAATSITSTSFVANWSAIYGVSNYLLRISTEPSLSPSISGYNNKDVGNVTSYSVTGLTPNKTYYYRVQITIGIQPYTSNIIEVKTLPTPSAVPTSIAATSISQTSFTANWNTSSAATKYFIDVAADKAFTNCISGFENKDVGNVTAYLVNNLIPNTTYYYRVRSCNEAGSSSNSNIISVTTLPNPTGVPTAIAATVISQTNFTANWNSASGATKYFLDLAIDNTFTNFVADLNNKDVGNVTTYTISGLTPNKTYYYRVRSYNEAGTSSNSNIISVITLPNIPTALHASSITQNSFIANWYVVGGVTGFYLDVSNNANFSSFVTGFNGKDVGNITSYLVNELSINSPYYYRIRAYNSGGVSEYSASIKTTTLTDIENDNLPLSYDMYQNYPNPFNPTTTINYQLPKDGMVAIKVYDIIGKEVATLVNGQKSAGYYKVDFDASRMTSGVYICSIQASSFNKSIKLLLTK